jgi:hypothetical protein
MFLVGYVGDGKDLKPDSKEIVELKFFSKLEAMKNIRYPETKEFFENNVNM